MFEKAARFLLLSAVCAIGADVAAMTPAAADQCYSQGQTRQMVQGGQAIALSGVLGQINAIGSIVSQQALLCDVGGRLVYLIDVIKGGQVIHVQIDAQSGAINY